MWPTWAAIQVDIFNLTFLVTGNQSCTMGWRNFGPFLLTELLQLNDTAGLSWITRSFKCFHNVSIGLRFGLWPGRSEMLHLFYLKHFFVDILVSLGLSSYGMTLQNLLVQSRIPRSINNSEASWTWGEKQPQTMMPPPPCFRVEIRFVCWDAEFVWVVVFFVFFAKLNAFHLNQTFQFLIHLLIL